MILPKVDHSTPQKLTYTHGTHHIRTYSTLSAPRLRTQDKGGKQKEKEGHTTNKQPAPTDYVASSPSEYPPDQASAGGLTYLVIADSTSVSRRVCFGFLAEARRRFLAHLPPETTDYADLPNYGGASFNGELRRLMAVEYGGTATAEHHHGADDAIGSVQRDIDDVKGIMTRNIEGLLERGERIDLLVDKTDRLGGSAREFRLRSRGLKRRMWWKNVKLMGLLGLVVVLILVTIVISVRNGV